MDKPEERRSRRSGSGRLQVVFFLFFVSFLCLLLSCLFLSASFSLPLSYCLLLSVTYSLVSVSLYLSLVSVSPFLSLCIQTLSILFVQASSILQQEEEKEEEAEEEEEEEQEEEKEEGNENEFYSSYKEGIEGQEKVSIKVLLVDD